MSDFLTRVAERALGTAPRIDPQSASRYAPSRLPLPESPLPESPLPETTRAAASDSASIAPPLDSYEQPAARQSSRPPGVTPVTADALATDTGHEPAMKSDRSPVGARAAARPLESLSRSVEPERRPLESQSRSIAQGQDTKHPDRASTTERPSLDVLPGTAAFEASTIDDDDRSSRSGSGPFSSQQPKRRTSTGYVSVPPEIAPPREEDELQAVAKAVTKDRDLESKSAVESIRSSTARPAVTVGQDRRPTAALDRGDARGAISADSIRPATARVDHSNYQREANSEPTIRVTIGRVEVRSAPPPAVIEPVTPPTPKLSLAEFLRQHNERRR